MADVPDVKLTPPPAPKMAVPRPAQAGDRVILPSDTIPVPGFAHPMSIAEATTRNVGSASARRAVVEQSDRLAASGHGKVK